ncbi:YciI family protein [Microscilla marina]|uniref:Ycii-related domain superfamily n=1 Tax=Microscilla marina ATCC 23134 TaxID=313606 RepID=A1ZS67_MICM2|nr:YciI family protein [Microscilla marina]EAY26790.1 ycii-related domain superfamily [Microscilla marina ATCC 23134]
MFIVSLTYKVPLEQVEPHLAAHIAYLDEQYALGNFHASGRKVPRTGGIILSKMKDKAALLKILAEDPFQKHQLVDCEVTEFVPSKTCDELNFMQEA